MTLTVISWLDVFTRPLYVNEIVKRLQFCQEKKGLEIYAYVIMTNHIHLVAARTEGEMSDVLKDFKSFTAKQLLNLILENQKNPEKNGWKWFLNIMVLPQSKTKNMRFSRKQIILLPFGHQQLYKRKLFIFMKIQFRAGYVLEPHEWHLSSACPRSPIKVLSL